MQSYESEQLDREAAVLLYAGGEMSAPQRERFEAQLASDVELVAELQCVREAMERTEAELRGLDERQRLPVSPAVAVRRIERAMQQWAVARLRRPEAPLAQVRRMPWWSYPVAAAAIVIVSFIVWSGRQPIASLPPARDFQSVYMISDAEAIAERLHAELDAGELATQELTQLAADDAGTFFLLPAEVASW